MRGQVLSFDEVMGTGLVSGDDGQRYPFARMALQGGARGLTPGAEVDFQAENGQAVGVFVFSGDKNRIAAALLALFLGSLGVHKFYLGRPTAGLIMLACGTIGWLLILPALAIMLIAFAEFIIYLVKSDQDFYRDYVVGGRSWL